MAANTRTDATASPDASTMRSSVADAFAQVDNETAERVQLLQMVYLARASQLTRIAADVKAESGADDADVKRAEAAVSSAKAVSSQVAMLHRRMTTPEPKVTKAYQQAYGFASSDETGYFLLRYEGAGATSTGKVKQAKEASAPELFVEVTDLKGRLVYVSDRAFEPAIGAATYQDIVVVEGVTKGEPPAQIRKVGMPKSAPKR